MSEKDSMKLVDFVEYEIASSWLCGATSGPPWLTKMLACWVIRRAERKMAAYKKFLLIRRLKEQGASHGHIMWKITQLRGLK